MTEDTPTARPLDVVAQLQGKRLFVVGGTGFLGKVWLGMVLHHYPQVGHIWLVVRPKKGLSPEERFWSEVATSPCFDPLRRRHGEGFSDFLRQSITPVPGDVSQAMAGVPEALLKQIRGNIDVLVNAAGVVDFNPPLDEAIRTNAFGAARLVDLARELGGIPLLHTSTCYVAGDRTGQIDEIDPREFPFPRADTLTQAHWDADVEIAECEDVVESVRHRTRDAFRQNHFHDQAVRNLKARGEPTRGAAFDDELERVRRKFVDGELSAAGDERAIYWGWHNTYTYTKALGEQTIANSGLPFTIVRPAVIESAVHFPQEGWNEGINTSAPLIYLGMKGAGRYPTRPDSVLDFIPVDMVAAAMILSLAELLEGTAPAVYQLGSSDTNPLKVERLYDIVALYKRRKLRQDGKSKELGGWIQAQYGPHGITEQAYSKRGQRAIGEGLGRLSGFLRKTTERIHEAKPLLEPATQALDKLAKTSADVGKVVDIFLPFICTHSYRFSTRHTQQAMARLTDHDRRLLNWAPESIDWREYLMDTHIPGLEHHVFPLIEDKIKRPRRNRRGHDSLVAFLEDLADRYDRAPALLRTEEDGFGRVSYRALCDRAAATALRLRAAGVGPGDRVLIAGDNHPDWVVAFFGIVFAEAVAVPLDKELAPEQLEVIAATAAPRIALLDPATQTHFEDTLTCPIWSMEEATAAGSIEGWVPPVPKADDVASIIFTSGTTGVPKGVMLTHQNFTALVASLSEVFLLGADDRVLSVLPLHHTFEFTCGLLLPLSQGARVVYLDELTGDRLSYGLREGRITALVGVPALWQLLERRITGQVKDKGGFAERAFDMALTFNRNLGKQAGFDAGQLMFGTVHRRLGGNLKYLISGGAALPSETHKLFQGLGLHLAEGYGLTEAAPVLTVAKAGPKSKSGTVGKQVPGVDIRIDNPDDQGVGEVVARGPNIMKGYFGDSEATAAVLDAEGWLRTGDLGRLDHAGRLVLVGRAKEVVVTATGENIYLDDVEDRLGHIQYVKEYALVGIEDRRGGERLAMLAVPEIPDQPNGKDPKVKARQAIKKAVAALQPTYRPSVVHLVEADLPRTATRKVKRRAVQEVLGRIVAASSTEGARGQSAVRSAAAKVAGANPNTITAGTRLAEDLAFDSLMWVELAAALEAMNRVAPSATTLMACETIGDVERAVEAPVEQVFEEEPEDRVKIPAPLVPALRKGLRSVQRTAYEQLLDIKVVGRALIPKNRQVICVSNHTSHLDMGLVKHALGPYGEQLTALAAADYFFEGNPLWVAYFDQLTNLEPIDRSGNFRQSFEQAQAVIERGKVVLLFPEGTRRTEGTLGDFKPLVGKLAIETGVDVLPLYLDGCYDILPKGSVVPKGRKITVRIGKPITGGDIQRLSDGLRPSEAARVVTQVIRDAVEGLSKGELLDASALESVEEKASVDPLERAFSSLPSRVRPGELTESISWYFSLGDGAHHKWTVQAVNGVVRVSPGRPSGKADCVIKTSPGMALKIIEEAYTPEVEEFMGGAIKTNEIPLLVKFSQSFVLGAAAPEPTVHEPAR